MGRFFKSYFLILHNCHAIVRPAILTNFVVLEVAAH